MRDDLPPFSLTAPRYDMKTFAGRARHFYAVTSPRNAVRSSDELSAATTLLDKFAKGGVPSGTTDAQLWEARGIKEACIHPDTGKPVPAAFRFAAFIPANLVIVPAMILPSTLASVGRTIGAHWLNQSYNAAVNFANRNASAEVADSTLGFAYVAAVVSSVGIALGATAVNKRVAALGRPALATAVRATLPYTAVASAGCLNLALMRQTELREGIELVDHEGVVHGKSVVAGETAIAKCCAARCLWNIPAMVLPPLAMGWIGTLPGIRGSPRLRLFTEVSIVGACIFAAVPPALGLFPQEDEIDAARVEAQFQGKRDSQGRPIERFHFNKGL
jgi:tricarboxylate carrier